MKDLIRLYIDGQWREGASNETIDVINPATEEVIGQVCVASEQDLSDSLKAVQKGFNIWKNTAPKERAAIIHRIADLMRERIDDIALACTLEQGKPLGQSKFEIIITANYFDDLADCGTRINGRSIPKEASGVTRTILYEPIGPVYAAAPWNLPAMMPGRKIATALAAGCSVIVKPSEETPKTAALIIQCAHDAGCPPGVLNLVYGRPSFISDYLIDSPVIRKISFTGSTPVGKMLTQKAGAKMKKVTMELGGHAPVIISGDADIEKVVKMTVGARYGNSGQSCMAATRFFVHDSIYDQFVKAFSDATKSLTMGPGTEDGVQIGPLTAKRRLPVMADLVKDAIDKGAKLECGGKSPGGVGYFFEPTVLSQVTDDMKIMYEEPFGPITPITSFQEIDEVIKRANSTPYGLASYIFTNDLTIAQRLTSGLEAGLVGVNSMFVAGTAVPFGGVKDSGIGREGTMEGILECMTTKTITYGPS